MLRQLPSSKKIVYIKSLCYDSIGLLHCYYEVIALYINVPRSIYYNSNIYMIKAMMMMMMMMMKSFQNKEN